MQRVRRGLICDLVYMFSNKPLMQRQARLNKKGQHDAFVPWQWFDSFGEESEQDQGLRPTF